MMNTSETQTLYIADLDETLLNKDSVLSAYTKAGLGKLISRGLHFTVATGRTTDAAEKIMDGVELRIPIITFNGAVLYDAKQEHFIKVCWMDPDAVKQILAILKTHNSSCLMYQLVEDKLVSYYETLDHEPIRFFVEDRKTRFNSTFCMVHDLREIPLEHVVCFSLIDIYDRLKPVHDALRTVPGISTTLVDSSKTIGLWWLEIFSAEASKATAVQFLRETYGYKRIVCFGDNYNDLPMFEICDVRVAVENALDEVKAAADCICESHDEDGVVKWIEKDFGQ